MAGLAVVRPVFASQISADGLVGYWKLDEGTGTSTADSSGHARTGTLQNAPTWFATASPTISFTDPYSLIFSAGSSQYISIGSAPTGGFPFTYSAWIRTTDTTDAYRTIMSEGNSSLTNPTFHVQLASNGDSECTVDHSIKVYLRDTAGTYTYMCNGSAVNNGAWHHVLIVSTASNNHQLYVDGALVDTKTTSLGAIALNTATIGAAVFGGVVQQYFNGTIDDVRMYKRALTKTEITDLAAGRHTQAAWRGAVSTAFENASNWSGSILPDPFTRVTIAFRANQPTLTGAVSLASLTINTGASLKLSGTGLTLRDAGTFTNYGTLQLKGNETLTSFTNDTAHGTVLVYGTGSYAPLSTGLNYYNLTLNDGLVGYWKFDETSGTRAVDSSGYSNSGTLVGGPTFSTSLAPTNFTNARSLSFDGVDDYVLSANNSTLTGDSTFTVSLWFMVPSGATTNGVYGRFVDWGSASAGQAAQIGVYNTTINRLFVGHWATGQTSTTTFTNDAWHHAAWIRTAGNDGHSGNRLFLDGQEIKLDTNVGGNYSPNVTAGPYYIGGKGSGSLYVENTLDDVRIYNRALSTGEIAALAAGNQPSLSRATYTLTSALDVSNNLTLNGGTLDISSSNYGITVGGSWLNNGGVFNPRSGTVTFDGTSSALQILSGGQRFNHLTMNGVGGTWTLADRLTATGTLALSSGTLDVSSSNYVVHAGNITQTSGAFAAQSGLVVLTAPTHQTTTITGTINDLSIEDPTEYGLVGYWKFDEGTNTGAILDSSGNNHQAVRNGTGAVWTGSTLPSLMFDNAFAMRFNGINDHVDAPQSNAFALQNLSLAAWMNLSASAGDRNTIVSYGKGSELHGASAAGESYALIYHKNSNILRFRLRKADDTSIIDLQVTPSVAVSGVWVHVSATWDGTTATLYQNGVALGTATAVGTINYTSDSLTMLRIGNWFGNNERFFNGALDDVRVYNRVLRADEVKNLYNGGYADGDNSTATFTLASNLTASGISILSGTFGGNSRTVSVSGNWNNASGTGGYVYGTSTVDFVGSTTQTVRGSSNFYNLLASTSAAQSILFGSGTTQSIFHDMTFTGQSSALLTLSPLAAGYTWFLDLDGAATQTVQYVSPSFSNASAGLAIIAYDGTSTDGGSNTNWLFTVPSSSSSSSSSTTTTSGGGGHAGTAGPGGDSTSALAIAARLTIAERFKAQINAPVLVQQDQSMASSESSSRMTNSPILRKTPPLGISVQRGRIMVRTGQREILYKDVVATEWYAPYVSAVIQDGVAQGYRDDQGNLTGEFGVAKAVTRAEVLKMALEATGTPLSSKPPRNASARGSWASAYIAEAEALGLTVFSPNTDVNAPATRGEVVQILLEVMKLPIGKSPATFSDVPSNHPYSHAIATAAFYSLIEGDTNTDGTPKNIFRPNATINRAEVAKIIATLREVLK